MLSLITSWWREFTQKRRWTRIYREATPTSGIPNFYLSICKTPHRGSITEATIRVWNRIPKTAQESLQVYWKKLQKNWDQRQIGIPLHLPVYGVFDSGMETAPDFGSLIGMALLARQWNNYNDSGDGLMNLFAGMFLPLYEGQTKASELELHVARRFANYFLWVNERGEQSDFALFYHDRTDELLVEWGFEEDLAKEESR